MITLTKSEEDLMTAFAGESQANRKYLAYAKKADKQGFTHIAKIFRAAAAAETVHALNHFKAAEKINSTIDNLKDAIKGERYEFNEMYPAMIEHAKEDKNKKAEQTFTYAFEVEKIHDKLYTAGLEAVEKGEDLESQDIFVCPVCGFTVEGEAPEKCPVCGAKGSTFMLIE